MKQFFTLRSRSIKVKGLDAKVFAFVNAFKSHSNWENNTTGMESLLENFSKKITEKHQIKFVAVATKVKGSVKFIPYSTVYEWDGTHITWDSEGEMFPGKAVGILIWGKNQWSMVTDTGWIDNPDNVTEHIRYRIDRRVSSGVKVETRVKTNEG